MPDVSHGWVNPEYKHLVVEASPKALAVRPGQFFNLLCPSPDQGELWLRRPQSVYRIDREYGRVEFLYKCVGRGTRGWQRSRPATSSTWSGRWASASPSIRPGSTSSCSAAASASPPWGRSRSSPARTAPASPPS